jgi:hypothetical protein
VLALHGAILTSRQPALATYDGPMRMAVVGPVARLCGVTTTIVGAAILLVVFIIAALLVPSVSQMRAPELAAKAPVPPRRALACALTAQ